MPSDARPRPLFLFAVLLVSGLHLFLVWDGRTVREHETGTFYVLQRLYLGASADDGPALWLPGLDGGIPAHAVALAQSGTLQSLLVPFARAFEGLRFPPLFFLGLWLDEMLLLVGCWCLASRLYRSPRTVFFVAVAATGGALWVDDAWLHLRSVHLVPLAFSFAHDFLRTRRVRSLAIGAALLVVQAAGTPPWTRLLPWGLTAAYLAGASWIFGVRWGDAARAAGLGRTAVALGAGLLLPAVPLIAAFGGGEFEPAASRSFSAVRILDHAGLSRPAPWIDLLTGLSPDLGATLYSGVCVPFLALAALRVLPSRFGPFAAGAWVVLAAVLEVSFALVPEARPDGPVPLLLPGIRLAAVFAAGAGFEAWSERRGPTLGVPLLALGALVSVAALGLGLVPEGGLASPVLRDPRAVSELLGVAGAVALAAGGTALLGEKGRRSFPLALWLLLLFIHPADAFGWKYRSTWIGTRSGRDSDPDAHRVKAPAYHARRVPWTELRRAEAVSSDGRSRGHELLRDLPPYGARRFPSGTGDRVEAAGAPPLFGRRLRGDRSHEAAHVDKLRLVTGDVESGVAVGGVEDVPRFSAHRVVVGVSAPPGGAWLVYSDSWDAGWEARVDGRPSPVLRTGGGGKAVRVEEGRRSVEWRYRDPARALGMLLGGFVSAGVALLGAGLRLREIAR